MKHYHISKYNSFFVIGLSYQKADAEVRGHFSLDTEQKTALVKTAKLEGLDGILVTSTCNRTEIYGFAENEAQLIKLLCQHTRGTVEEFEKVAYIYKNKAAISHIFKVGTGLDSQILGDFEIIGQLKTGFLISKKFGVTNYFFERLVNEVIRASKRIKNETELSSGATSVAFASVQYILNHVPQISEKNILLFGTGKIGRNTCENLVKHTQNKHITLINRTKGKAEKIAGKFNLTVKDYSDLQAEIRKTDVLIVATGAQNPTISKELIYSEKELLILDLSIPKNVADDVANLENVTVVHLDYLSKMTDSTLEKRKTFVPQAQQIISEVETDFNTWLETRKFVPTIKALKEKLSVLKDAEIDYQQKKMEDFNHEQAEIVSDRLIQKIMNRLALHLRNANGTTEQSLELIQEMFQLENPKK
ncbi:MAG TPA: glutamyl-tRNA reductase [Flavobacteriaceae bacterium]|nr:glutamyl-tRNA reductase [Flavobacteriaceae bacterium]